MKKSLSCLWLRQVQAEIFKLSSANLPNRQPAAAVLGVRGSSRLATTCDSFPYHLPSKPSTLNPNP